MKKTISKKKIALEKTKNSAIKFKKELKKSVNTALVAAFGFIIALSWRDVVTESVNKISELSPLKGKIIHALIVTLLSVIGILLITKFLSE
jgi:hypothetical protein